MIIPSVFYLEPWRKAHAEPILLVVLHNENELTNCAILYIL